MNVSPCWDGKDVVQLFKCPLLGLRDKQEDHDKRNNVEASIKAEGPYDAESDEHLRERDTKNSGPTQTGSNSPTHPDFTVGEREDFGRIGKRYWTFSRRIEGCKDIDEKSVMKC